MKFKTKKADLVLVKKFMEDIDLPRPVAELLVNRGFKEPHDVLDFLLIEDKLRDPFGLPDMEKTCARLTDAIKNKEQITICGDYDVDGSLATVILLRFLSNAGAKVNFFIPHRTIDGYGISDTVMENLHKQFDSKVIISVDTGTTAFDAAEKAKELKMDLIVTDHHNLSDKGLPPVYALINAKRPECVDKTYEMLAGSGVAYYIIRALNQYFIDKGHRTTKFAEEDYQVLAMMASIADVVPLKKDNRVIVKYGLQNLPYCKIEGLEALFRELAITTPTARDIAWRFAPIINAAGRLGSANQVLELFTEKNKLQAAVKAQDLINLNKKRQKISEEVNKKVLEIAKQKVAESNPEVIIVAGEFHVGVIGISAAKIVDAYKRPAVVIGWDETGYGKASCRTIEGFNVKKMLDATKDYHLGGGGHDMAAGFSINKEQLESFEEAVLKYAKSHTKQEAPEKIVESEVEFDEVTDEFIKYVELLEPFGQDNPAPRVKINNLKVSEQREVRGGHIMFIFENELRGMLFNPTKEQKTSTPQIFAAIGELSAQKGVMRIVIEEIIEN